MKRSLLAIPILLFTPLSASAHVKWFAQYDVSTTPRPLAEVLSTTFIELILCGLVVLWAACQFERTPLGAKLLQATSAITNVVKARLDDLLRAATAVFFIAIAVTGNFILTPELTTKDPLIPLVQAGVAFSMFWRVTMPTGALGIVFLFGFGITTFGLFHMMDYPIFLGLALYLAMSGLDLDSVWGVRPLDVARWGAAITLIWASVEKWAYPQWTYPLLAEHSRIGFGLTPQFYLTAAGFVEFSLAFSLLWTPLVRRTAAVALSSMFIGAIFEFGKIDAIGHLMIIAILATIAVDDGTVQSPRPFLAPLWYCAVLAADFLAYYGTHAVLYRSV